MFERLSHLFHHTKKPVLASRNPKWSELRSIWLMQQPVCQACSTEKRLEVHHIVPVHIDPGREMDQTNLITLCQYPSHDCHYHIGHLLNWKAYNPTCREDAASFKAAMLARPYTITPKLPPPPPAPLTTAAPSTTTDTTVVT